MSYKTGVYYDRHPETGEPGKWRLFPNQGWANVNANNAPAGVAWNQRGQNYVGRGGQYYRVNPNTGEESVIVDQDGNERPGWYYSGMMGWINTAPNPNQKPQPVGSPEFDGTYVTQEEYDNYNPVSTAPPPVSTPPPPPPVSTTPAPADPVVDAPPSTMPRTGMLSPQQNSWIQVLNRQGADLNSWDPYLGMFTNRENNIDWSQLDSNQVQSSFDSLAGEGLFPNLNQGFIYTELLKRLGFA